jgi:hypothetical protein
MLAATRFMRCKLKMATTTKGIISSHYIAQMKPGSLQGPQRKNTRVFYNKNQHMKNKLHI